MKKALILAVLFAVGCTSGPTRQDFVDAKKDVRQLRLSSSVLDKDLTRNVDYIFTANSQENNYVLSLQGQDYKSSGASVLQIQCLQLHLIGRVVIMARI